MEIELLTTEEVAKLFRVSEAAVYRLVKQGELRAIRRGKGYTRYRKCDVEAFLDRFTVNKEVRQ